MQGITWDPGRSRSISPYFGVIDPYERCKIPLSAVILSIFSLKNPHLDHIIASILPFHGVFPPPSRIFTLQRLFWPSFYPPQTYFPVIQAGFNDPHTTFPRIPLLAEPVAEQIQTTARVSRNARDDFAQSLPISGHFPISARGSIRKSTCLRCAR